ncbi:MAG: hypothetical protein J7K21_01675 [Desulfurococcales archaeon]|nr:hypothetical protein [Desulfurococcales archaeon]
MVHIKPDKGVYCKKCGRLMNLIVESEKLSNGAIKISYYYKCPSCGYRVDTEQVAINRSRGFVLVKRRIRILS